MADTQLSPEPTGARYEYRVWGKHRSARKRLAKIAKSETTERVVDCYLLVDDATWNAKIRDNTLKIKQLVAAHEGFEQWTSDRYRSKESAPSPFDDIFEQLRLDRPQRGKKYNLMKELSALDANDGVRVVFVTKRRRRYRVGNLRAEATDIEVHETGEVLNTLSIEGDDVVELTALRDRLGLIGHENVAVPRALEPGFDTPFGPIEPSGR